MHGFFSVFLGIAHVCLIILCRYVHFDFHHICGHVHFERLSMLYDQISDFLERNGYGIFLVKLFDIYFLENCLVTFIGVIEAGSYF